MEALEWFSAAELADHKIAQLPGSIRAIQLRAKREEWSCRNRTGRGGGFEYPLSTLPENIQASLLLKQQALNKSPQSEKNYKNNQLERALVLLRKEAKKNEG